MSLATAAKSLSERGIPVKAHTPGRYRLHVEGRRRSTLDEHDGTFGFRCWDFVPGPGPAAFIVRYPDLDAALLAVWHFYFGEAVQVGEWRVSMHEHPAWSLAKVTFRAAQAIDVAAAHFEATAEARLADMRALGRPGHVGTASEGRYAVAMRSQFIACPCAHRSTHTLMLRRDLEEAYVVEGRA